MLKFTTEYITILDEQEFAAGTHEIEKPSKTLLSHAEAAHNAGMIVVDGMPVEDEDAQTARVAQEAADYQAAQGEWVEPTWDAQGRRVPGYWTGGWHDGNVLQYRLEKAHAKLAAATAAAADDDSDDADEALAEAHEELAAVEKDIASMGGES